jgi:transposase
MQLQLKTLLNHVHSFKGFVYEDVRFVQPAGKITKHITAKIVPRKTSKPLCSSCKKPRAGYDHQPERSFVFVPLWGMMVYLLYAPRRVECPDCGVRVEEIPWAQGNSPMTTAMICFLATWAKRMSWSDVGKAFGVSWDYVSKAVTWIVEYGLLHQDLSGITAIGVDEIAHKKGHKFITLVYQLDAGRRRLGPGWLVLARGMQDLVLYERGWLARGKAEKEVLNH